MTAGPLLRSALLALGLLLAAPLAAQPPAPAPAPTPGIEALRLHAFTLSHQRASEGLVLIQPLLSPRGTVEIQAATNTLVVRDSLSALARVQAALAAFDHPSRPLAFDVQLVRAEPSGISPVPPSRGIDADLEARLGRLFRYQTYRLLARARLDTREGEEVVYELTGGYRLTFKLGTLVNERRVKLHGFRITRRVEGGPERELIHTAFNLWRGQPFVLGLARDEDSPSALLVVVHYLAAAEGP